VYDQMIYVMLMVVRSRGNKVRWRQTMLPDRFAFSLEDFSTILACSPYLEL